MEIAGVAVGIVGLAGLFASCLETIDRVNSYLKFDADLYVLESRFDAVRIRFKRWGPAVGIGEGELSDNHHPALNDKDVVTVVENLLRIIKVIGEASDSAGQSTQATWVDDSPSSCLPRLHSMVHTKRCKLAWAFWRKKGRTEQVELFEKLTQGLCDLVPPDRYGEIDEVHSAWLVEIRQMLCRVEEEIKGKATNYVSQRPY